LPAKPPEEKLEFEKLYNSIKETPQLSYRKFNFIKFESSLKAYIEKKN